MSVMRCEISLVLYSANASPFVTGTLEIPEVMFDENTLAQVRDKLSLAIWEILKTKGVNKVAPQHQRAVHVPE